MSNQLHEISDRIREMREIIGFTMDDMAQELGVATDVYENYEACGENIPISKLYHMANLFQVDIYEIITGRTPRIDTYCIVPAGKGVNIDRYPGYNFEGLAYRFINKIMEPMLVTVDPCEGDPELVTHEGQEFNLVIEGSIEILFDDKRLLLEKGDSIYFNPTIPHGQKAMNNQPAKFLTVISEKR